MREFYDLKEFLECGFIFGQKFFDKRRSVIKILKMTAIHNFRIKVLASAMIFKPYYTLVYTTKLLISGSFRKTDFSCEKAI